MVWSRHTGSTAGGSRWTVLTSSSGLCHLPWHHCQGPLVAARDTFHGHVSSHLSGISTLVIFLSSRVCHAVRHCLINYFTSVLSLPLAPAVFCVLSARGMSRHCRAVLRSAFSVPGTGQVRSTTSNRTRLFCLLQSPPMLCCKHAALPLPS